MLEDNAMNIHIEEPCCGKIVPQQREDTSEPRKGMPKKVILYTDNEEKSKAVIAEAMAEMYLRMINPV